MSDNIVMRYGCNIPSEQNKIKSIDSDILAILCFMKTKTDIEIAEYINFQQKAIDGLTENNNAWVKSYRKIRKSINKIEDDVN